LVRNRSPFAGAVRKRLAVKRFATLLLALLLVACGDSEQREAEYLERGKALFEQGEYDKARLEFKNARQINPKNIEARYYQGLINERQGNWRNALKNFRQVTFQQPDHLLAQLKIGHIYLLAEALDEAEEQVRIVQELAADNPDVLTFVAAVRFRRDDLPAAREGADAALAQVPGHVEATMLLARLYQKLDDIDRAIAQVNKALELNPDNVAMRTFKATLHIEEEQFDEAEAVYRELIELQPESYPYRASLVRLYLSRERLNDAEQALQDAIAADVGGNQPKVDLVELLEKMHGFEAAEAELKRLIEAEPDEHEFYFILADRYWKNRSIAQAKTVLQDLIDREETGTSVVRAQVMIAGLYLVEGDKEKAEELIDQLRETDPGNSDVLLMHAGLALEKRQVTSAIADLRRVLGNDPASRPALQLLTQAHLLNGDIELAVDSLRQLLEFHPQDTVSRQRLAFLLARRGEQEAAIRLLNEVLEEQPSSVPSLQAKVALLIARQAWSEAEASIEQILALPGQQALGETLAGAYLLARGRSPDAMARFLKARELAPTAAAPLLGVVVAYARQQKLDEAVEYLSQEITTAPANAMAHNLFGEVAQRQNRSDDAAQAFRKAMALRADWTAPVRNLGRLYNKAGEPQRAVEVYKSGLERLPGNRELLLLLAESQQQTGDNDGAIATYEQILDVDADSDLAANNLASLVADFRYQDEDDLQRAFQLIRRFETSGDAMLLDTLGWLQYRMGDLRQSRINLERAVQRRPDNPQLQYHLGIVLYRLDDSAAAREALEQAVVEGVSYPGLEEARTLLAELRDTQPPGKQ
jgi:tetratricopeptide (TPR) repeat protein